MKVFLKGQLPSATALLLATGLLGPAGANEAQAVEAAQRIKVPEYVSPLKHFKKYEAVPSPQWVKANQVVREVGG